MNGLRVLTLCLGLAPGLAFAHHSMAEFDDTVVRELTGEVVRVQWRNPHIRMSIRVSGADGTDEIWEMEGTTVNSLDRAEVPRDIVETGQQVRVAGLPSTRRARYWLMTNILLPDGREVLVRLSSEPRWTDRVVGNHEAVRGRADEFVAPVADIFRVWSTVRSNPPAFTRDPPLTAAARSAYDSFDPLSDDPVLGCVAPGMPEAMTYIGPHPVGFVRLDDGNIEIHIESDDNVRIVHMDDGARPDDRPPSPLGVSVGHWEDDVLLVTTTRISWPYFKVLGLVAAPQSEQMEIVERFALDPARGVLTYGFTATDPTTFTEPVTAEVYHEWLYRPGVEVEPYECTLDE